MPWLRLFLPFAGAYFLSNVYRSATALVGPELSEELALGAGSLGFLTSTFFLTFASAQLPLGMLLDRFGARRVESALLLIAACGAISFSLAQGLGELAIGRSLIGLGVSACLMAALKTFSLWFPLERQASLTGWIMTAGGLGALTATVPLEAALHLTGWRDIFVALAVLTLAVSLCLLLFVPEKQTSARTGSLAEQWAGVREVFRSRHFWRFAPLGLTITGGYMAVQSLWSISWLMEVNGYTREAAAGNLAGMNGAMLFSYIFIGLLATRLARRGITPVMLLGIALALSLLALALIVGEATRQTHWLWIAYGAFSCFATLIYSQTAAGFPPALSGRATTSVNLLVFSGAFVIQWGLGLSIELLQELGQSVATAHRSAFFGLLCLQITAFVWFFCAGRAQRASGHAAPC